MTRDVDKKERRRVLRKLAGMAYERELRQALAELEAKFKAWREGKIGPFELSEHIHRFHNGIARELWKKYQYAEPETIVPVVVAEGVLKEEEVPSELLEGMRSVIDAFRGGPAA